MHGSARSAAGRPAPPSPGSRPAAPCPAIRCPGQATVQGSPSWRRRPRHRRPLAGTSRPRRRPPSPTGSTRHRSRRRRGHRPCPVLRRPVPCRRTRCPLASGQPTSRGSANQRSQNPQGFGSFQPAVQPPPGPPPGPPRRPPRRPGGRRSGSSLAAVGHPGLCSSSAAAWRRRADRASVQPAPPPRGREHRPAARHARRVVSRHGHGREHLGRQSRRAGYRDRVPGDLSDRLPVGHRGHRGHRAAGRDGRRRRCCRRRVSDRAAISNAASDVGDCGPSLAVGRHGLQRRRQLTRVAARQPHRHARPRRAAARARQRPHQGVAGVDHRRPGLRQVGERRVHPGLRPQRHDRPRIPRPPSRRTSRRRSTRRPSSAAWNPIAAQYGLTQYQQGQL